MIFISHIILTCSLNVFLLFSFLILIERWLYFHELLISQPVSSEKIMIWQKHVHYTKIKDAVSFPQLSILAVISTFTEMFA